MPEVESESGGPILNPRVVVNPDYSVLEKNNYISKPSTFSAYFAEFEWWKINMYTHIIDLDDQLYDILDDGIDIVVDGVGMLADRKSLTHAQKKIYRKHHRVRRILVDALPHSEYLKILNKSSAKTIFESLCATYEGNQQVKEEKANLLV